METKKTFTEIFQRLNGLNVNEFTEKRNGLTYLSWQAMTDVLLKHYPDARFCVTTYGENNAPYYYDENLGYMVHCTLTIEGYERDMYLPVMDSSNRAMKAAPYIVKTKYKEISVDAATMFDINTAIMRCKVKCAAMFGLGLYIYNGEDLPKVEQEESKIKEENAQQAATQKKQKLTAAVLANEKSAKQLYEFLKTEEARLGQVLDPVAHLRQYYDFDPSLNESIKQLYNKQQ